jgi:uncharacterized membrane protein
VAASAAAGRPAAAAISPAAEAAVTGSRPPFAARIRRWLRHALASPRAVDRAFPPAALDRIAQAVAAAERGHSGEIRFAVETALPWSYLKRDAPARERALMVFAKLRVWDTEANNGVLLYVELADRSIEIVADRGIARQVPASQWQAICEAMRARFRAGEFERGVIEAVQAIAGLLAAYFPTAANTDRNELPDRPVRL